MASGDKKALYISLGLHVTLLLVLIFGDLITPLKPKETPVVVPIQATIVDKAAIEKIYQEQRRKKQQEIDRKKRIEDEKKRKAEDARKKKGLERKQKLEQERKRKEAEKRKKAEAQRKKKEAAEKERKRKEEEQRKKVEEQKRQEELRKKREQERLRKEQEARERALEEEMMAEQLEQEMAERNQARNQQIVSEVDKYTALIRQTIQSRLITDKATMQGKTCKLALTLAPDGLVISVAPQGGAQVVCNAAVAAVKQAGRLPVSRDPAVFSKMRKISLIIAPEF
ncbi:cell envelope integrity protein TolA [Thalassotalea agarivorans]|uniref:Cell division and transport-associated protein TolA n=1 Tax=Thalassotalea agarivorans TaxID=349064 RepID=A0A1I0GU19_THASX|nr:cell envelope integrity protein TolA [Thalassotalea agarivorans]SET74661.1 Cell division and transport-associated protein TolA [Thalassotalea agarivorans]